jgi:manganese transport protein
VIPLVWFVSDRRKMGEFAIPPLARVVSWVVAAVIVTLNLKLLLDVLTGAS